VVLSRSPLEDETLEEVADRIVRELAAALDGFEAGPRETASVAGEPARILQFQWTQNG